MARRVLLIAATTGYQLRAFEQSARGMGLDVVLATDRCHQLEDPWGDGAFPVRFENPEEAAQTLSRLSPKPQAVVAVGDRPTLIASLAALTFGLPFHSPSAVLACRDKFRARERFREAGLAVPSYTCVPVDTNAGAASRSIPYPCVLKPLGLSGSRGVIRANNVEEFHAAFERIRALLQSADIRRTHEEQHRFIQIESYIPGLEYALEGIVTGGRLRVLALFDKPDPLEGPFFEETIYMTPSCAPQEVQDAIRQATQDGVRALGLSHGPIHAEMRYNDAGVFLLEIAARPIGGLCANALRFTGGVALEELILRHALAEDIGGLQLEDGASGVMMIPIPKSGIYNGVAGVDDATATANVDGVTITAKEGQRLLKLPEGASYLGFIFARAATCEMVDRALRQAHQQLRFDIGVELPVLRPAP
jgi:formate-dependent phosphoribosylglycinamide formyltransferase (GAR transformylase)